MAGECIRFISHLYLMKRWKMKDAWIAKEPADHFYNDYQKHKGSWLQVHAIHAKGFTWDEWHIDGLTNENYQSYLKTAQYYAMHPLNGKYTHWIDDKLTLKYLCGSSSELDRYMPEYYFQIDQNGQALRLPDFYKYHISAEEGSCIAAFLRMKGELAFKRIAGSLGEGFYKAAYRDGRYYLNEEAYDLEGYSRRLRDLKNYLVTEYLHPHTDMVPFSADTVNTIRYLIARDKTGAMRCVNTYVRFGTQRSGFVENYGAGGVLCYISADGTFDQGNVLNDTMDRNLVVKKHPDTGVELNGTIPHWNEIQSAAEKFGKYFPQMDYLGLDFVVTNTDEVKILEVNSLTSLDALQMYGSVLEGPCGEFFQSRVR